MIALASIIERFGADYLAQYGDSALPSQRQALNAMKNCRSNLGPGMLAQCGDCGEQTVVPHSCGHRNCPHCQHFESQRWIERQTVTSVEIQGESPLNIPVSFRAIGKTLPDVAWDASAKE